ncbi:hypothetical protein ACFL3H_01325 [Gemmatimonadota bacterium]
MDHTTSTRRRISRGIVLLAVLSGCSGSSGSNDLTGEYLGQELPGRTPVMFAPGLVSTPLYNRDLVLSDDGDEIFFGVFANSWYGIVGTERKGNHWTDPQLTSFSTDSRYMSIEPALSVDGNRLYFLSNRPPPGEEEEFQGGWGFQNIWVSERTVDGWSDPGILPSPVTTDDNEFFPSLTGDGTLYFTRTIRGETMASIWRARPEGESFGEPEILDAVWNREGSPYNAWIDREERFLLFCLEWEGSVGPVDYWVSFRNSEDSWSDPVNLGEQVNRPDATATSISLSPDGRYLFFARSTFEPDRFTEGGVLTLDAILDGHASPWNGNMNIWWVDASFIEELREP